MSLRRRPAAVWSVSEQIMFLVMMARINSDGYKMMVIICSLFFETKLREATIYDITKIREAIIYAITFSRDHTMIPAFS